MHTVHKMLPIATVCHSVCLCWSHACTLQKRPNQLRCGLTDFLRWAQEPCIR